MYKFHTFLYILCILQNLNPYFARPIWSLWKIVDNHITDTSFRKDKINFFFVFLMDWILSLGLENSAFFLSMRGIISKKKSGLNLFCICIWIVYRIYRNVERQFCIMLWMQTSTLL